MVKLEMFSAVFTLAPARHLADFHTSKKDFMNCLALKVIYQDFLKKGVSGVCSQNVKNEVTNFIHLIMPSSMGKCRLSLSYYLRSCHFGNYHLGSRTWKSTQHRS